MRKRLLLSVSVDLPGSLFEDAAIAASIQANWATLLRHLERNSIGYEATAEYSDARRWPIGEPVRPTKRPTPDVPTEEEAA